MTAQDQFERTLALLHRAALGDATWVSAAASVNDLTRASGHSLGYGDQRRGAGPVVFLTRSFAGAERREDWERSYFRDYWYRDEAVPRLDGLRDGELVHKADLYTDQEKKTSPVYNEFRRLTRSQNGLYIVLDGLDGYEILWSFADSMERGGWGYDQIQVIRRLAPHICHFARVRRALADAKALGTSSAELLDNQRSGMIQLDRQGCIVETNDRARDLLLKRDGLTDEGGVLAAETPGEDAELQRLLGQALPPWGVQGAGGSMKVTRPEAGAPLVLEIQPVRELGTDHLAREVGALVLVIDPLSRPRIDPALPAEVFGLTPAQSRVAVALAAGQTVTGTARALGVTEGTVRVHLKNSYRKMGITSQTELVRQILSLEPLRGSSRSP